MNSTSRATAFLVAAATALVLGQAASAAQLGLTVSPSSGEDAAAPAVDVEVSAAGSSAAASVDLGAPSVSAAVQTSNAGARIHAGAGTPAAADDPPASGGGKGSEPRTTPDRAGQAARDRSTAPPPGSERALQALEPTTPLDSRAAKSRPPLDELAPFGERSDGGWWSFVQAAGAGVSGSPFALLGVLLVAVALFLQAALGALRAFRPSLLSFVLQRPG